MSRSHDLNRQAWRKSSHSQDLGACVEVVRIGALNDIIAIRDSKDPGGGHQVVTRAAFADLVNRIKNNDLDG